MRLRIFVVAVSALAAPAVAQQAPAPLAAIDACRAIADNAQRLACFDRAAAALSASVKSRDVLVVDRETLVKERRRQFGRARKDDPALSVARIPDPVELKGKILAVQPVGQFLTISVEGVGVWRTTEGTFQPPKPGAEARITRGTLGGYILNYGSRALRARRIG